MSGKIADSIRRGLEDALAYAEGTADESLRQVLTGEPGPNFDDLSASSRSFTRGRCHTPSEALLREGRNER